MGEIIIALFFPPHSTKRSIDLELRAAAFVFNWVFWFGGRTADAFVLNWCFWFGCRAAGTRSGITLSLFACCWMRNHLSVVNKECFQITKWTHVVGSGVSRRIFLGLTVHFERQQGSLGTVMNKNE